MDKNMRIEAEDTSKKQPQKEEFAPVKNATGTDSVDSARELLKKNGIAI